MPNYFVYYSKGKTEHAERVFATDSDKAKFNLKHKLLKRGDKTEILITRVEKAPFVHRQPF